MAVKGVIIDDACIVKVGSCAKAIGWFLSCVGQKVPTTVEPGTAVENLVLL
jgi:hypothetical protein